MAHLRRRVETLSHELGHVGVLTSGNPSATRSQELSYVFVMAYGRSGSTLLQGILSSTPGLIIRGENGNVLQHLFRFHECARTERERQRREMTLSSTHAWWGIDGYEDVVAFRMMRELMLRTVLRPETDTRVIGFKELRWPIESPQSLTEFLSFTREVFPGARFVVNTRDLDEVAGSGWWPSRPDARATLESYEKQFRAALEWLGDDGYHVHYNDYCADPTLLRGLFEWLGEEFDEERVRSTMQLTHSMVRPPHTRSSGRTADQARS
jgi:hypothetical protein